LSNKAAGGEAPGFKGSVRQIVTDAANPVDDSRFDYTAYGLDDTEKDYSGMNFYAKCPYKFAGTWGYYDGSGRGSDQTADAMVLCGHRFYSPGIARWLTEDPIGFRGGWNVYAYCHSDPAGLVDPSGTDGTEYFRDDNWIYHRTTNPDTGMDRYYPVEPVIGREPSPWHPNPRPESIIVGPYPLIPPRYLLPLPDYTPPDQPQRPTPPSPPRRSGISSYIPEGLQGKNNPKCPGKQQ
jgi:RHS repeat-associated protein